MSNYLAALDLNLSAAGESAGWRRVALESIPWAPAPAAGVSYVAANRLLIIAEPETARRIQAGLPEKLLCYTAIPAPRSEPGAADNARHCAGLSVDGYLGRFRVLTDPPAAAPAENAADTENPTPAEPDNLARLFDIPSGLFDQVLDCSDPPLLTAALKPPGYHCAADTPSEAAEAAEAKALAAIPELIGEFEKPKYFHYDPDLCAHGRSGIGGCTRCLDACPAGAIFSAGERVEVVAHLCHGGGACAGTCPSGAIRYAYPAADEQLELLRVLLKTIRRESGNRGATLLIFDNEHGREAVQAAAPQLAGEVLPLAVEEIGSVGLDLIAAALAYGANRVCLYVPAGVPAQVIAVLEGNLAVVAAVLEQTGCRTHRAELIGELAGLLEGERAEGAPAEPALIPHAATFAPVGGKRVVIRAALTFFGEIAHDPPEVAALPAGAPFGGLALDAGACTLCMGCVAVCPAAALEAGGDTPALRFIEANCVQCGICANACPESALALEPRLLFHGEIAARPRTLKAEAPFRCIACGKPFATESMIARMTEKLAGHWLFQKPEAVKRLRMCEECRVKDLLEAGR